MYYIWAPLVCPVGSSWTKIENTLNITLGQFNIAVDNFPLVDCAPALAPFLTLRCEPHIWWGEPQPKKKTKWREVKRWSNNHCREIFWGYLKKRKERRRWDQTFCWYLDAFLRVCVYTANNMQSKYWFGRGVRHDCGTALNEATTIMGYWVWSPQRTCIRR